MKKPASLTEAAAIAQFRLAIIAPVIHELYPDSSRTAYYIVNKVEKVQIALFQSAGLWPADV